MCLSFLAQEDIHEIFFSDSMGPSLQGKVCLVTGAARGIGRGEILFNEIEVSGSVVFDYWASCLMGITRYRGIGFWGILLLGIGRGEL